jgi:hypothetical protein
MPRFVAVYTMKPEDLAAFRARPKSEQEATDKVGLKAWEEWGKRNAAAIVACQLPDQHSRSPSESRRNRCGAEDVCVVPIPDACAAARGGPHWTARSKGKCAACVEPPASCVRCAERQT